MTTEHSKPVESGERTQLIEELMSEATNLRAYYAMFGLPPVPGGQLPQERAAVLLAADGNALTTNGVVDQKSANVDDKAGGEARHFDLTLTKNEAEYIAAFVADENEPDDEVVRIMTGPGHSGYGLYAFHPDYLDEGAVLVKSLPTPAPMKAADEFELRRLLAEEQYTVRQLNRALREATEPPTFMGEPVIRPQPQAAQPAERVALTDEQLARKFHEVYERLAPSFGYETRKETRQFDPSTPNGKLMVAVCGELLNGLTAESAEQREQGALTISGHQLREALEFLAPDGTAEQMEQEVCIQHGPERTHDEGTDPAGLYCWLAEYPEEGSIPLTGNATPPTQPAGVPDGCAIVPIEPTDAMIEAMGEVDCTPDKLLKLMYSQALSAAPQPAAQTQGANNAKTETS